MTSWASSLHHCHDLVSLFQCPKGFRSFKLLQLTTSQASHYFHTTQSFLSGFFCLVHWAWLIISCLSPIYQWLRMYLPSPDTISTRIATSIYSLHRFNFTSVALLAFCFAQYSIKKISLFHEVGISMSCHSSKLFSCKKSIDSLIRQIVVLPTTSLHFG
jgi:hypothetical protein